MIWLRQASTWVAEPDELERGDRIDPVALVRLAAHTATLLVVFFVLRWFSARACRMPDEALRGESILGACLAHRPAWSIAATAALGLLVVLTPRLRRGWSQFEGGLSLRWFVGVLVTLLAWSGSAYVYNAWYDRFHGIDRLTLLLLATLTFWRPVFVVPFVVAFWAVVSQFGSPPLGFQNLIAEFKPLVDILTMFGAALIVQCLGRRRRMTGFVFVALCSVAANFWVPGHTKLQIGWLAHGHVYLLLPNAYTHGWLAFLTPQQIAGITQGLSYLDWPMRLGTLAVECATLFFLTGERTARALLLLSSMLLGVFFLTLGYFFWKWMALHVAIWCLVFRPGDSAAIWRRELFTPNRALVSIVVIGVAVKWLSPAALAWFDTPLSNTVRYEAVGASGTVYELPSDFFAPYESHIAMASFVGSLTPGPILASSYGVTHSSTMAAELVRARGPADVARLETQAAGRDAGQVDHVFGREFDEFLLRTIAVSNRHRLSPPPARRLLSALRPPPFLWTYPHGRPYRLEEPIAAVRVYRVSSFFDGQSHSTFRRELLRTVAAKS